MKLRVLSMSAILLVPALLALAGGVAASPNPPPPPPPTGVCTSVTSSYCEGLVCERVFSYKWTCVDAALAKDFCVVGERECVGYLICIASRKICVIDPCYTTACFANVGIETPAVGALPVAADLPPVGACVKGITASDCWEGDVCVGFSYQVPVCADVPCYGPIDCIVISDPGLPPLVGVCVEGVTAPGCYGGHTACVGFSLQVPFCVDVKRTFD